MTLLAALVSADEAPSSENVAAVRAVEVMECVAAEVAVVVAAVEVVHWEGMLVA